MDKAEDRISNLPDSILHHILSFLPTEIVACTSVLSHRWKHVWTSIPNLEFVWVNPFDGILGLGKSKYLFNPGKFMDFVNGTLDRHSLSDNIQKFSFKSMLQHFDESQVISCISNVLRHNNIKELSLSLHQVEPLCFPVSTFTCASLISLDLELQIYNDIRFPGNISFPRLKHLRLRYFEFSNDCWNEKLFFNSPVLEELYLDSCTFLMPIFCISIPTLRILKINWTGDIQNCALKIHAPSLLSLLYKGYVAKEYVLSSFVTLVEAVVHVYGKSGKSSTDEAVSQIFGSLAHVNCLTVNVPPPEEDNLLTNLPSYHNLKQLKITGVPNNSDVRVISLLKVTPNLESLVIEKEDPFCFDDEDNTADNHGNEDDGWTSLDRVATRCLFLHLKSFCFRPSIWGSSEISCVKVILRNAKALQSLTIDFSGYSLNEIEQDIQSFPRASSSCTIKICGREELKTSKGVHIVTYV